MKMKHMNRTQVAFCVGVCFLLMLAAMCSPAENGSGPTFDQSTQFATTASDTAKAVDRFIFISIEKDFEKLERAPVRFNHDKHTAALEPEGCDRCHPKDEKGAILSTFPKIRNEKNATALMDSFHDECTGCHQKRAAENKKTGPATCGECHRVEKESKRKQYAPILPEHYNVAKDTYHKDCLACHREPAKSMEAGALDWKRFYVKERRQTLAAWPKVSFDYLVHGKHEKALEQKCELCHYISPARRQKLAAAGKPPENRDWLMDTDGAIDLTEEKAAHALCINCHLARKVEKRQGGPYYCNGCHTGVERSIKDLSNVLRSQCGQEDRILIQLKEDARAKGVPFDHKSHEANSRSCQDCHHKTLRPCGECHSVKGGKEGGGITLAEAYHEVSSSWSCIGCHETVKKRPACAGCHDRMESGLVPSACDTCHSGSLKSLDIAAKLPVPRTLVPSDSKDEVVISVLEKAYQPSNMPHLVIAKVLTDISNQSTLASYFHRDETTICKGCHHNAPLQAKSMALQCSTCHMNRQQAEGARPTLLGAYHQQCLGCHKQMVQTEKKLPQNCTGCHKEKPKA